MRGKLTLGRWKAGGAGTARHLELPVLCTACEGVDAASEADETLRIFRSNLRSAAPLRCHAAKCADDSVLTCCHPPIMTWGIEKNSSTFMSVAGSGNLLILARYLSP